MAKNMGNTNYRKIDVDAYDPEKYNENEDGLFIYIIMEHNLRVSGALKSVVVEMAKNMGNTNYRKIDVDAYDPEKYNENEDGLFIDIIMAVEASGLGPDERNVLSLLQSNRLEDALHTALLNPPLKCKNQAVKDKSTTLIAKVLGTFKCSEIESVVKKVSVDEADILMKYVYKAMELMPESTLCQTLLAWHSLLVARFGLGSIIRVFSERNRL
ncbi:hypothetical protein DICVIV_01363 [Dictyocaulus viviparus]|uniref:Actin-related protein 2/3 complex subunit 5 n=1 Tax=Dictyocaulus viviparus TaxID=29172 RepID=A0A0D8YCS7_DICVI|nr:hypothetical protein DICVIV_01363 [Dictyocaulus viviparus]